MSQGAPDYAPARPPNERDVVQTISGQPEFLGVLTSTTAARVNNATTAVPFNIKSALPDMGMKGSLAGMVLLLQPTGTGVILPADDTTLTIAQQTTAPSMVAPFVHPGVLIAINERVEITMSPSTPFLQWMAAAGTTASLLCWRMR